MKVRIEKLTENELQEKLVFNWPVWEKEVSSFPWHYDLKESCYILLGEAVVTDDDSGEEYHIKAGDFVIFPAEMSCRWDIKKSIKKHYNFG